MSISSILIGNAWVSCAPNNAEFHLCLMLCDAIGYEKLYKYKVFFFTWSVEKWKLPHMLFRKYFGKSIWLKYWGGSLILSYKILSMML